MISKKGAMLFEWDDIKYWDNIKKHGLTFETAELVFLDPNYIDIYDELHSSDSEERHLIFGLVEKVLCVVCIICDDHTRIISCRLATKKEEGFYYGRNA